MLYATSSREVHPFGVTDYHSRFLLKCGGAKGNINWNASDTEGIPDALHLHACSWRDRDGSVLIVVTLTEGFWEYVEEIRPTPLREVETKLHVASME